MGSSGRLFFHLLAVISLLALSSIRAAADPGSPEETGEGRKGMLRVDLPLSDFIGYTLEQAHSRLGVPEEVFPFRGMEEWQDNVVFYYKTNLYLFWFKNRVWQVRADKRYKGSFLGLSMGSSRARIISVLGKPFYQDNGSVIYILPDRGYPVRIRLFFEGERLSDLYVYRGDF